MRYVEAPARWWHERGETSVFLGGGITDCPDWQAELVAHLAEEPLLLINPRRTDWPMGDPDAALEQIAWEHDALRSADAIAFWFPKETLCPITLYELGAWSMTSKPLFVGVHPEYKRRLDVEYQTELARPDVTIMYSVADLATNIACTSIG